MKYTLLELAQAVLSSMDSDEINSINDSVEAQQVATVIRTTYFDIISRANLPEHFSLFNLNGSGDNTKPTLMFVPNDVEKILWVKYNRATADETDMLYETLDYMPKELFLDRMYSLSQSDSNVVSFTHTFDGSTVNLMCRNDVSPSYYTTFDDYTVVFDSYDAAVDTTLQGAKTLAYGRKNIPWTMSDSFIPDLDESQFQLLLNESKALAWAELKQIAHQKAEQTSRRYWVSSQKSKTRVNPNSDLNKLPNFGRR